LTKRRAAVLHVSKHCKMEPMQRQRERPVAEKSVEWKKNDA
jgi:hypothetical protein